MHYTLKDLMYKWNTTNNRIGFTYPFIWYGGNVYYIFYQKNYDEWDIRESSATLAYDMDYVPVNDSEIPPIPKDIMKTAIKKVFKCDQ